MKPDPERQSTASIDRVIFWSVLALIVSLIGLGAIAVYAVKTDQLATCLNAAGIVYTIISTLFLGVIAMVFVTGHLGSSREIEAPKMELFELEKRR
jgi:thiosulfate reductase cytochrome b subunit